MVHHVETIIIGAGQAGLATSYLLTRSGHEHLVLEQAAQPGNAWRSERWDSFTLNTPNWTLQVPGMEYQGDDPDGFLPLAELIKRIDGYVQQNRLPIQYNTRVTQVQPADSTPGYLVHTPEQVLTARNVVIATGLFQTPKSPPSSQTIPPGITQLSSGSYRNPQALPPGAVLVVGSAQSGCQVAEELYLAGRKVYLSVSTAGRAPRRYRGRDVFAWMNLMGFLDRTVEQLPNPQARFAGNPQVSGRDGGRSLNLHQFYRDGVTLLGHFSAAQGDTLHFSPDLQTSLQKNDAAEAEMVRMIDGFIVREGIVAPEEALPFLQDAYQAQQVTTLSLASAGIHTIIWAMGYHFDFSLVQLPVLDSAGFPITRQAATAFPGLYFIGMPWLTKFKSGLLLGVGEDAAHITQSILGKRGIGSGL